MDEERISTLRMMTRIAGAVGGLFGFLGVILLFWYVWEAFPDMPTRIGWWAVISIVLCVIFLLGYAMASDTVRSEEREGKRKAIEK
jgi:predicted lysophospholipase L1 biosynthesis ABC-type transport system permease subunit